MVQTACGLKHAQGKLTAAGDDMPKANPHDLLDMSRIICNDCSGKSENQN